MAPTTAEAIEGVAAALRSLGTNDAADTMGAIEFLSTQVKKHGDRVGGALDNVADGLGRIADALDGIASEMAAARETRG